MNIYLVKRGPQPEHHRAPFHPVIVCCRKFVARWEAGSSSDGAWVWSRQNDPHMGWLLERWNGLDIDYGHVVHAVTLPDGTDAAFHHRSSNPETWALLKGAVWWSTKPIPQWLRNEGVVEAPDEFSQSTIRQDEEWADDNRRGFR